MRGHNNAADNGEVLPDVNTDAELEIQMIANYIRAAVERSRQRGYDAGYEDALSLTADSTPKQLSEQGDVGSVAQRVA